MCAVLLGFTWYHAPKFLLNHGIQTPVETQPLSPTVKPTIKVISQRIPGLLPKKLPEIAPQYSLFKVTTCQAPFIPVTVRQVVAKTLPQTSTPCIWILEVVSWLVLLVGIASLLFVAYRVVVSCRATPRRTSSFYVVPTFGSNYCKVLYWITQQDGIVVQWGLQQGLVFDVTAKFKPWLMLYAVTNYRSNRGDYVEWAICKNARCLWQYSVDLTSYQDDEISLNNVTVNTSEVVNQPSDNSFISHDNSLDMRTLVQDTSVAHTTKGDEKPSNVAALNQLPSSTQEIGVFNMRSIIPGSSFKLSSLMVKDSLKLPAHQLPLADSSVLAAPPSSLSLIQDTSLAADVSSFIIDVEQPSEVAVPDSFNLETPTSSSCLINDASIGPELSAFLTDVEQPSEAEVRQLLSTADGFNLVPLSPSGMIKDASMASDLSAFLSDVEQPSEVEVRQLLSHADSFNLVPPSPSSMINDASMAPELSTCSMDVQEAFQTVRPSPLPASRSDPVASGVWRP